MTAPFEVWASYPGRPTHEWRADCLYERHARALAAVLVDEERATEVLVVQRTALGRTVAFRLPSPQSPASPTRKISGAPATP